MPVMRVAVLLLLTSLVGCQSADPYQREGVWRPNGANGANLRTMTAVPSHLTRAARAGPADGILAAAALARLHQDKTRPLPDSGIARLLLSGGSAPPAAAPLVGGPN